MALSNGTAMQFVATAYGPPWDALEGSGVTSTGVSLASGAQRLVVAVDPSVVPYGTKLQFNPNPFGDSQLVFTASDTGGAIVGNRIDFFIASGRTAQNNWGIKTVTGTVVGSGSPTDVATLGQAGSTQATAGGTAGLGGTGTTPNASSAAFQVGDTSNPDEDYFTAINRLSQSAYWYTFSDGETLYVADGPMLMQQTPARVINRFAPDVLHIDMTYDNTAFQFASHHKKRGRIQRKATLAKVVSPVEAQVQLIGPVDAIRGGDVVMVNGTGVGDGRWLVGTCRRSVFAIYSELTLVPALAPIPAVTIAGVGTATGSSSSASVNTAGQTNPAPGATWSRLDQGFDGNYGPKGAVAAFSGTVHVDQRAWPGQGDYIALVNDNQNVPNYQQVMYYAEGAKATVPDGTHVNAGQQIGTPVASGGNGSPGNFEIGPGTTSNFDPLARAVADPTGTIMAFYTWMRSLGAGATSDPSSAGHA